MEQDRLRNNCLRREIEVLLCWAGFEDKFLLTQSKKLKLLAPNHQTFTPQPILNILSILSKISVSNCRAKRRLWL